MGWIMEHRGDVAELALGLFCLLELIVRLTPTKVDDGFLQRFGSKISWFLDAIRVPNLKKK